MNLDDFPFNEIAELADNEVEFAKAMLGYFNVASDISSDISIIDWPSNVGWPSNASKYMWLKIKHSHPYKVAEMIETIIGNYNKMKIKIPYIMIEVYCSGADGDHDDTIRIGLVL